jgi:glycosyltransferase involved in cell wall biosynthesis
MAGVAVVIPTLNEEDAIGFVLAEIPAAVATQVIIADSGSADGTVQIARVAGASVIVLAERGYGRACAAGAQAADAKCDIIVFMDGDGADRADLMAMLVEPVQAGTADFVIAARPGRLREAGAMSWHQVVAGRVFGLGIRLVTGVRYTDMCAFRAIRRGALEALNMREMTYGWNIEMQMKAAKAGLRILEIPLPYRRRVGGESKVAGSLQGTLRAAARIVAAFLRVSVSKDVSTSFFEQKEAKKL